jgi:tRNA (guanine10-N2)-dimethyltransferase
MLPPKLARMMINISGASNSEVLLDPFCGSGTVLTEAILLGFQNIIGSDNSEQAIIDTKKNVGWILEKKDKKISSTIVNSDVRKLVSEVKKDTIGVIVAEPYMGKPLEGHEREDFLSKQAKELGELYTHAFEVFKTVLKPGGIAVFIIPRFWYRGKWIRIDIRDSIERMGFEIVPLTEHEPYILYHRPGQFVGREVWKLRKK